MRILCLDDDPKRQEAFRRHYCDRYGTSITAYAVAFTADEAIDLLLSQPPFDIVQLDHDLDGKVYVPSGTGTGYEVAAFMAESGIKAGRIIVHSYNGSGALQMLSCFVGKGIPCEYRPFGVCEDEDLITWAMPTYAPFKSEYVGKNVREAIRAAMQAEAEQAGEAKDVDGLPSQ